MGGFRRIEREGGSVEASFADSQEGVFASEQVQRAARQEPAGNAVPAEGVAAASGARAAR